MLRQSSKTTSHRWPVGVARQYCGQLGKQDNCQVAVSLSLANEHASLPAPLPRADKASTHEQSTLIALMNSP